MILQLFYLLLFELKNAYLRPDSVWGGILYFILTLIIMPFTLKISNYNMADIAPTMIWIALVPAIITASNRVFSDDIDDGFIDRYMLMRVSWGAIFLVKICVLYLCIIIPALLTIPILQILFLLSSDTTLKIIIGLLCSTPAILFFTGFGTLLSLHSKIGHIITFIVVMPLIVPAIILGAGIVYTHESLMIAIKLPIAFSLLAILMTVPASSFLYKTLYEDR